MMNKTWIAALIVTTLAHLPMAASAGDPEAGAQKALVCGACHGMDGNSINPEWPNLAGQHESYIVKQLGLFKQGVRNNAIMMPNAMLLTDEDMADLAAYFSRQPLKGLEADPSNAEAGKQLYRAGDPARGLPACIACHGPEGKGNGPAQYPALRAQHSLYTYLQLRAYASGERVPAGNDMMQTIASKMTDEEMRAVASYLQGLR
jgi:cytochrome c553